MRKSVHRESLDTDTLDSDEDRARLWVTRLADDLWYLPARAVLTSLGELGLRSAFEAYIRPINRQMHENAASVVAMFGAKALPLLLDDLANNPGAFASDTAELLRLIGGPEAIAALHDLAQSRRWRSSARWRAIGSLRQLADPTAVDIAIKALRDRDWMVVASATKYLRDFGDARALPELERKAALPSMRQWRDGLSNHIRETIEAIRARDSQPKAVDRTHAPEIDPVIPRLPSP